MAGVRPADEDRLPWLEPYRDTRKPGAPLPRRGYGKPLGLGLVAALVLAVGAGGYWLGQRSDMPAPTPPSATIALPAPKPALKPAPVQVAEAPPVEPPPVVEQAPPAPAKVSRPAATRKKSAARKRVRPRKIRSAGIETEQLNAVRAAQERPAPKPRQPVSRPWPKMPSPGPAGQVIQLGAFSTPSRASRAYQARIARYPLLGRMPRVIVPVATRPTGRVLYVLRLGTTSRQQSKTVCRNLRRSGDHCLVIG
jgi:hypothetical protein